MRIWAALADGLARRGNAVLVTIAASAGSTPREAGTRMIVFADGKFTGTIGGGTLEWRAIAEAQRMLAAAALSVNVPPSLSLPLKGGGDEQTRSSPLESPPPLRGRDREGGNSIETRQPILLRTPFHDRSYALGPELGQCCGGRVTLRFEVIARENDAAIAHLAELEATGETAIAVRLEDNNVVRAAASDPAQDLEPITEQRRPLYLFGAGHVGRALVLALAPLPFDVTWIDPRREAFPQAAPGNVQMIHAADPVAQLAHAPSDAFILILTHSHELDLALCDAALRRERLPYIGVIGSATKRARFESRLRQAGVSEDRIASLVCPIGAGGPKSKLPAAIAAATAVELLVADERAGRRAEPATGRQTPEVKDRRLGSVTTVRGQSVGNTH